GAARVLPVPLHPRPVGEGDHATGNRMSLGGFHRRERPGMEVGSVSVLTAGILVLGAVLTLVAVDLMRALLAKARAQTAADAAALAAAQEIAIPSGQDP